MKTKNKIQGKISDLEQEVEQMEQEVKRIVNSDCGDWSRVTQLVNGMNIIANQIQVLRELY